MSKCYSIICITLCLVFLGLVNVRAQGGSSSDTSQINIDYSNYVGVYENPDSTCAVFFVENDALFIQPYGMGKFEIVPNSATEFPIKAFQSIKFHFVLDEQGSATGYTIEGYGPKDVLAVRISDTIPVRKPVTLTLQALKKYAGYYQELNGNIISVILENDKIYVDSPKLRFEEILPESLTDFFAANVYIQFSFRIDTSGKISQLNLHSGRHTTAFINVTEEIEKRLVKNFDNSVLQNYAGNYRDSSNCFLVFKSVDEHMYLTDNVKKETEVFPESETTFLRVRDGVQFTFIKNAQGAVTRVSRQSKGAEATFERFGHDSAEKSVKPFPPKAEASVIIDGQSGTQKLGITEGASWMHGTLYFSDQTMGPFSWKDGRCKNLKTGFATCGTTPLANGNLAVCDLTNKQIKEIDPDGKLVKILADGYEGEPFNGNPNDLTTDLKGGIYFTVNSLGGPKEKSNVVFYLTPQGEVLRLTEYNEIPFPNGIVASADGSKLFVSSHLKTIIVFDINEDGTLSNKRDFTELCVLDDQFGAENSTINADGMEIDTSGSLYVTTGAGLQAFNKKGELIDLVPIGGSNLTFGGPDMSTLYITRGPRVFAVKTNTKGYQYPIR